MDDIFANRFLLAQILQQMEIDFDEVSNGKEAIEALGTRNYDVVLMDIEMPVMNGLETTKYIREKMENPKNQTIVVALTAHNPEVFFDDFKDVGFDSLLTKPYSMEKISALIMELGS